MQGLCRMLTEKLHGLNSKKAVENKTKNYIAKQVDTFGNKKAAK